MGVEDAEAPGREDEEADPGEEDPGQGDGELESSPREARGQEHGEGPGQHEADDHQRAGQHGQEAGYRAGHPAGLLLLALGQEAGVDRDERAGQHALAEQVLEQVRDAQGGPEGVDGRPDAEQRRR